MKSFKALSNLPKINSPCNFPHVLVSLGNISLPPWDQDEIPMPSTAFSAETGEIVPLEPAAVQGPSGGGDRGCWTLGEGKVEVDLYKYV